MAPAIGYVSCLNSLKPSLSSFFLRKKSKRKLTKLPTPNTTRLLLSVRKRSLTKRKPKMSNGGDVPTKMGSYCAPCGPKNMGHGVADNASVYRHGSQGPTPCYARD